MKLSLSFHGDVSALSPIGLSNTPAFRGPVQNNLPKYCEALLSNFRMLYDFRINEDDITTNNGAKGIERRIFLNR